jgi:hypothetical protein
LLITKEKVRVKYPKLSAYRGDGRAHIASIIVGGEMSLMGRKALINAACRPGLSSGKIADHDGIEVPKWWSSKITSNGSHP